MELTPTDLSAIEGVLGPATRPDDRTWLWQLHNAEQQRMLALTLSVVIAPGGATSLMMSVQTLQGYSELHAITSYLCIEPDEVMFIAKHGDRFNSMVVGTSCTCSQFSNITVDLAGVDLTTLDTALLMAAVQLSLAESVVVS